MGIQPHQKMGIQPHEKLSVYNRSFLNSCSEKESADKIAGLRLRPQVGTPIVNGRHETMGQNKGIQPLLKEAIGAIVRSSEPVRISEIDWPT